VVAHRRIHHQPNMLSVDQATQLVLRPTSAAFDPDDDGLSVYLDAELQVLGLGPRDVRAVASQLVAGLTQKMIDDAGLTLVEAPDLDDQHPRGPAHALLQGWEGLSLKKRKAKSRALSQSAPCTYPGGSWSDVPCP